MLGSQESIIWTFTGRSYSHVSIGAPMILPWFPGMLCCSVRYVAFFGGTANVLCCSAVAVSAIFSSKLAGIFALRYSRYSPRFAWGGRPHRRFISVRERG